MIYVVLGMHKSGTTLVASLLHHAGIAMVEGDVSGDYDDGVYYERQSTYRLNIEMLNMHPEHFLYYPSPKKLTLSDEHRRRMRDMCASLSRQHDEWGFKDPRTCLTYPLWAEELPPHRLVVVFRPVQDIWHRYRYDGWRFWNNFTRAVALMKRWCEYNQRIIQTLQTSPEPYLVLSFDRLLDDERELQRLQDFIERPLRDVRTPRPLSASRSSLMMRLARWLVIPMGCNYHEIFNGLNQLRGVEQYG